MDKYNKFRINQEELYKLITFIFSFATTMVFTINILYQIQVAGLLPWQLVIVGTCLELTCFIFEIPTGVIADRFSRKLSVILGFALIGTGFMLEGSFPYFITIATAQIVWGIGFTCVSGALDAWVLDETGKEELYISGSKFATVGQFLGIATSIALAQLQLNLPIVVGGILLIILAFILVFSMTEKSYKKTMDTGDENYFINTVKVILSTVKTSYVLAMLFAITFLFGLYSEGFDRLWGNYILDIDTFKNINGTYLFGGVAAIISIIGFFTFSKIEEKVENISIKNINKLLILLCSIIASALLFMSITEKAYALIFLVIIINLSRSIIEPFETIWFNKLITDSSNRATVLSLKGQIGALGQIGSGLIMGAFSILLPLKFIFALSAIIFSPVILIYKHLNGSYKE